MKSDFDLIVHRLPECKEAKLYFVGDLHVGAIECNLKAWEGFVARILAEESSYICLMGDLMNNATRSSVSNVFEDTMRPREQKRYLANALTPLRERILCAVSGNHEFRSGKDVDNDPTLDIMSKLDLEDLYRQNAAFVKICFGSRMKSHGGMEAPLQTYVLCCTHGAGGGIYTGAAVNRNERFGMVLEGVDILAVGHTHKGTVSKPSKLVVDIHNNVIVQKSMTVVSSCSWLSYGGYALRKMLLPSSAQDAEYPQTILLSGGRYKRYIKTVW
jgi:predicted phosphodiesterase